MREALLELKEDGLIDDKENVILLIALEEKMKRLWHSPSTIPSFSPEILLENLPWVIGNDEILAFVKENATLVSFGFGEIISEAGDSPNGIYVIVTGMVKVLYVPNKAIITNYEDHGIVPNMELFLDLTFLNEEVDFFSTGTIIGEKNVLTDEVRCATVTCETVVSAYHLPQAPMKQALNIFTDPYDSLESRMWRSYGIKLATALLPTQPAYASWTLDKIRMHLERSAVPIGERFETLTVPEYISDVVVIQGQVRNYHTKEVYQAPSLVPRSCSKFAPIEGSLVQPRVLVVAQEEIDHEEELRSNSESLQNVIGKNRKEAQLDRRRSEMSRFSRTLKRDHRSGSIARKQSYDRRPKLAYQKPA
jgi:CRP-like cAMP-binding protein